MTEKILFITSPGEDYLQDSLLHGFKSIFGRNVVEFPVKPQLYSNFTDKKSLYGNGFSLYCTLSQELMPHPENTLQDLHEYTLIVFSSVHRQHEILYSMRDMLIPEKTLIVDGEDGPSAYPTRGHLRRDIVKSVANHLFLKRVPFYFKREFTPATLKGIQSPMFPFSFALKSTILPLSFSIPETKISHRLPVKTKMFPTHIVDPEVCQYVEGSVGRYAFSSESKYYADLQQSRFGITTKRAGWDCMRHYEISANGTVPCFKDLDLKPTTCSPSSLDESNCISYRDYQDLLSKISSLSPDAYTRLQNGALDWIKKNSTRQRVIDLLNIVNSPNLFKH